MSQRFFEYGKVQILIQDSRQIALEICLPISLLFSTLPILLKHGQPYDYTLNNPLSVWLPSLNKDRINPKILALTPNIDKDVNELKGRKVEEILKLFQELGTVTLDQSDLVPMLPLGTYTLFKYRCEINQLPLIDLGLENINIIGVLEFKTALRDTYEEIISAVASACE
jgi:hypothetical protein